MGLETLVFILIATIINSLIALVGIFTLWVKDKVLRNILFILVAFSAGALLSGAFFHLITESLAGMESMTVFIYLISGFIIFFLTERILYWHHCHEGKCDVHPFTYLILIGDGIHNFIDGLIIAASFAVNIAFGFITTLMIISHEIPQELGDFGVLVYGGFEKKKALGFNLLAQLTCVLGGIIGFLMSGISEFTVFLLPFAAGGFIYIAASDLIPELHKEESIKKSMVSFLFFLIGIGFLLGMKFIFG